MVVLLIKLNFFLFLEEMIGNWDIHLFVDGHWKISVQPYLLIQKLEKLHYNCSIDNVIDLFLHYLL